MKKLNLLAPFLLAPALLLADDNATAPVVAAVAAAAPKLDGANTAWVLTATALVMLMTPAGLALFYGGMTRAKNLLNTIAMSFIAYAVASIVWVLWAYSLAFGTDVGGVIGSLTLFLGDIKVTDIWATGNIPTLLFVAFQMTFAAITVALASGSVIERFKLSTWMIFVVLWITVVYAPIAHMVWYWAGPDAYTTADAATKATATAGFVFQKGALDFAGGTVVHINAGIAGLVGALVLGKRVGFGKEAMAPHSVTLTMVGAAL